MKKVKLIYNPISGEGKIKEHLDKIIELYQNKGYSIIPFRLGKKPDSYKAFDDLNNTDYHHLIFSGGDGTINSLVNIYKEKGLTIPLAFLPLGTANDFSKCLGMPDDIEGACKQILSSEIRNIDLGLANDRYFINVASFGLFTEVSQNTPDDLKNTIGKLAYYIHGIKELPKFEQLNINVKSEEYNFSGKAFLVFVFNGKTAGGINISYKAEIDDGLLDVVIVAASDYMDTAKGFFQFMLQNHLDEKTEGIIHFKTKKVDIECDNHESIDVDGEKGPGFPITFACEKDSIPVLGVN